MSDTASTENLDLPENARALLEAVLAISSDLDMHSVLNRIVVSACEITGAKYGALGVLTWSSVATRRVVGGTASNRASVRGAPSKRSASPG
jgi:hypothetical protein